MNLSDKVLDYLKQKLPDFQKTRKKGQYLFTCPNIEQHKYKSKNPTATFIPGSDKINCLQCGWKGTGFDVVRLLEQKSELTDTEILEYFGNGTSEIYPELDNYKNYKWSMMKVAKNGKAGAEKAWTQTTYYEKTDWIKWLNSGFNLGCRTGEVSQITAIDIDLKIAPTLELEEFYKELNALETLTQNSPHGKHFVVKYVPELKTCTKLGGLEIDIRNDGAQILVQPSKINHLSYCWKNLGTEIKELPDTLKEKLLNLSSVKSKSESNPENYKTDSLTLEKVTLKNNNLEGCCNDTFVSLGGMFLKKLNTDQTEFVLNILNQHLLEHPMPSHAIQSMMGSLTTYKENEDATVEEAIYNYLRQMQIDITAKDIMDSLNLKRAIVDKYLSKLYKEGKTIRLARGRYKYREKVEWSDKIHQHGDLYKYGVPYFDDFAYFEHGDIILVGGKTAQGKTTIAMNFIKQLMQQKIKPYYIYLEAGSRYQKTAASLGLTEGDNLKFYSSYHANPLSIEIEPNAFTIVDWLLIEDKATTDVTFKYLNEEMQRKGGLLVIFTQLKESYEWFAPNMVTQFPALAARYIFDSDDGSIGHFSIDKLRDPKGNYRNSIIPCEYSFENKILKVKEIL